MPPSPAPTPTSRGLMGRARGAWLVVAVGVAGAAFAFGMFTTRHGIGEGNDSSHYLSTAENLRDGHGLDVSFTSPFDPVPVVDALRTGGRVPLTHFPPAYPVALALVDAVAPGGMAAAARLLGAISLAVTALAAMALASALLTPAPRTALSADFCAANPPDGGFQNRSRTMGAVLAGAVGVAAAGSAALVHIAQWAMSDAAATAVTLAAIATATVPTRHPGRRRWISATLALAAVLTRFVGAAAAIGVAVLLDDPHLPMRTRVRHATSAIAPTVIGMGAVLVSGSMRHGDGARPIAWHPFTRDDAKVFTHALRDWVIGERSQSTWTAALIATGVIAAAVAAFAAYIRDRQRVTAAPTPSSDQRDAPTPARVAVALAAFCVAHLAILAITSNLLDTEVSFDRRLLLPIEIAVATVVLSWLATRPRTANTYALAVGAIVVAIVRLSLPTGGLPEGVGTPTPRGEPNALYAALSNLEATRPILTNVPESVWRETRRSSIYAPSPYDKLSGRQLAPDRFVAELLDAARLAGQQHAVLLVERPYFYKITGESPRVLGPTQVASILPCATVILDADVGVLYDLTPCAAP